jgi:hypothetical protein
VINRPSGFRASLRAPGNGPGTQGIPAIAQDARARLHDLLMDRFDWFVMGVMLTCAALIAYLYW